MHNQLEQEHQVKQVIARYHREPIEAAQRHRARSGRSSPMISLYLRLRARLDALLGVSRTPQEAPNLLEPAAEPVESTATS